LNERFGHSVCASSMLNLYVTVVVHLLYFM